MRKVHWLVCDRCGETFGERHPYTDSKQLKEEAKKAEWTFDKGKCFCKTCSEKNYCESIGITYTQFNLCKYKLI